MKILLHNMSAPPKSKITKKIEQIDDYLCFSPINLAQQLNCSPIDLAHTIKQYVSNNPNWMQQVKRPSNYMIALTRKNVTENFFEELCTDISLQLYVFGSIVGDIYIPNRKLNWFKDTFERDYYFLKKEVLE